LAEPLVINQRVIAPRGAMVIGQVADSNPGGRVKGVPTLRSASRNSSSPMADREFADNSPRRSARTTRKRDAAKIGIGAGAGAGIGAIAGGGVGAAIGAAWRRRSVPVTCWRPVANRAVIPSESRLTFRLSTPVTVSHL